MRTAIRTKLIYVSCLLAILTACYTSRVVDTKHFIGTAKVARFGVKFIPNTGLNDTVYHGIIKLNEKGNDPKFYHFESIIKTYEKTRYFVISFSDKNRNKIEPSVLFNIKENGLILGRYTTLVIISTKVENSKMTKEAILEIMVTWLNRDRYSF